MRYQYPLEMSFKIVALTPQFFLRDAQGRELMYVRQKMFKLREDISVFSDSSKQQQIYTIRADRIIDFSARYSFTSNVNQQNYGSVKRRGVASLWSATYDIFDPNGQPRYFMKEADPWVKVADGCFTSIPFLGFFSGYVFHPSYLINDVATGQPVMRLTKQPALFEGRFRCEAVNPHLSDYDEVLMLLSYMMMLLLERRRG
ncbi:MAG: hypothetical protein GYB65_13850 [Chloroflexi bacterium]|nr:hypothetical protein [Chloroflexota bacterium]